jgi:hypothetical protein
MVSRRRLVAACFPLGKRVLQGQPAVRRLALTDRRLIGPAVMHGFAYTSYKHQSDQELLSRLSNAILVLKLRAQGRLGQRPVQAQDVQP